MARPKGSTNKPKSDVDMSILTIDERAEIELQVEVETQAEQRAAAKEQLREELKLDAKRRAGLEEPMSDVTVDLAPYCDRILLDNRAYLQGQTYNVRQSVAQVIREQMQRTWNHQAEIDGKSENWYRRSRGVRVLPNGGVVNTSQLLRA